MDRFEPTTLTAEENILTELFVRPVKYPTHHFLPHPRTNKLSQVSVFGQVDFSRAGFVSQLLKRVASGFPLSCRDAEYSIAPGKDQREEEIPAK